MNPVILRDMQKFIGSTKPNILGKNDLAAALYTVSEAGGWPDAVDSVSEAQAIMCWRIVEKLRQERLPDKLKM